MYNPLYISFKALIRPLAASLLLIVLTLLSGCSTPPTPTPATPTTPATPSNDDPNAGRYSLKNDAGPDEPLSVEHIEDAHPKYEAYSRGGNRNYTLRGNYYTIIKDPKGYSEQGQASWYGKKFHGHMTSNGEIYDMYSMTAAHKTLPIPSYIKVTNLNNNKTAIVRVNDRGPFHQGRIIDLSYVAAYKLGVAQSGTADVKIEVITVMPPSTTDKTTEKQTARYAIQVSASQDKQQCEKLAHQLSQRLSVNSFLENITTHHRVFLGPFNDYRQAMQMLERVKSLGYSSAFIKKQ